MTDLIIRADEGADHGTRAREIEQAVKEADAKRRADEEGDDKLDKILGGIEKIGQSVTDLCGRVDALEAGNKVRGDELSPQLKEKGEPRGMAADGEEGNNLDNTLTSAERADAARKADGLNLQHQSRADAVASAWGERAPPAMSGEAPHVYRIRLLQHWQRLSPQFKDIDLNKLHPDALEPIESMIYADAKKAADNPTVPDNRLIARTSSKGGHEITTFYGRPSAWMSRFAGPVRRHVVGIKTQFDQR